MRLIERRVETAGAEMSCRILFADCGKPLQGEARGGVHGQIKNDQFGFAYRRLFERLAREVQCPDGMPASAKPCGGGGKAKWLAPQFVGSQEQNFHDGDSIARC